MKKPLPHIYLSEYLHNEEKKGLLKYYSDLIQYKQKEIEKLNIIVSDIAKQIT